MGAGKMGSIKKEVIIYLVILVSIAIIQHPDLLVSPIDRAKILHTAVVYGMGAFHPFIFGLLGYLFVGFFRIIIFGTKKIFKKKDNNGTNGGDSEDQRK